MDQHVQKEIVVQVVHIVEQDTIIQQDVIHVHGHQEHINVIVQHQLTNVIVHHIVVIVINIVHSQMAGVIHIHVLKDVKHVVVVVHVLKQHVRHVQVIHQEAVVQNVEVTNMYQAHIVRAVVGQIERVQTTIIHVQMVENYQVQIVIFKIIKISM